MASTMLRSRWVNSAVAFALAALVAVTLHEVAHAVAGLVLGRQPVLYPFSVDQGPGTDAERVTTALAGPLFSLISGVAALAVRWRGGSGFVRLAWLWFGLVSVQSFASYLITGPFATAGDIGLAWQLLDVPGWVPWLGFATGGALTVLLGAYAAGRLGGFVSGPAAVGRELPQVGVYGWLLGTVLAVVLSAASLGAGDVPGEVAFFSALGIMASGVCVSVVGLFRRRADATACWTGPFTPPLAGATVLLLTAVLRQVALGRGLSL